MRRDRAMTARVRRLRLGWRLGWRVPAARSPLPAAGLACALAAALLTASAPPPANADVFGPISLASEGSLGGGAPQQAEYAHDAAISGDGRYVAFDGSFGGVTGVWRRDLATGVIEPVAGGDAELPSISETGRYISFTSTEELVPEDETTGPNVWVRDMEPGPGEPEYLLVSAVNGSAKGLTYEYAEPELEERRYGSEATGRSALGEGEQGLEVAFVTTAASNLAGPHTPPLQVAVRYLQSEQTVLVSGAYDPLDGQTTEEPVSTQEGGRTFGAVYPGAGSAFRATPANGKWAGSPPPGASISADGSTVAWLGEDVGEQVRMLPEETPSPLYTEPLWRRIAPGSQTPTERVTGGSDPADPACAASGERALPSVEAQSAADPCQGPFRVGLAAESESRGIWSESDSGEADFVPRLSADGYTVAFAASALPIALGLGFGETYEGEAADLYVADMHPGLTRVQALTPVTEIAGVGDATADPITDFDISPGGGQVAFTTRRTEFPLGSPAYVSAPAAVPGESELFDADLGDDTLTQVTHGYEGGPSFQPHGSLLQCGGGEDVYCTEYTEGAQSPSFSDGGLIAFSSTASNLVFGDGNTPPAGPLDGSDAFVVERRTFSALPTPQDISPAREPVIVPAWQLGVTALARPDGSVLLYVQAPGPGTLRADARGSVLVRSSARTAKGGPGGGTSRTGRAVRGRGATHTRERILTRTVATAARLARAGAGELVVLTLTLAKPYAALASAGGGLSAGVSLTFAASGHPALHQSIEVTFHRTIHPKRRPRKHSAATDRRRRPGR